MQSSLFNAQLLHKTLTTTKTTTKKTSKTEVRHASHSILNFKTKNHAIKVTYTKMLLLNDTLGS